MNKLYPDADAALFDVKDGVTILSGGFGLCGNPENCIDALVRLGVRDLTLVSNNCGVAGKGLGKLLEAGQVRKMIASYVGENKTFERLYLDGKIEGDISCPQDEVDAGDDPVGNPFGCEEASSDTMSITSWGLELGYAWLGFVLARFPFTRAWGEQLNGYLLGMLFDLARGIITTLPNLFIVAIMFLLARGVVGLLKPLFDHVARGNSGIGWLDRDTVEPTRKIANILIWIFALVMAYPYLPGSHTEAFKGMSVLVGLMISLGASSVVGQGASGLILMYSRTLRTGEYVRIGEHEGTIVNISLFTTRLRTGRGAEITLPNALIVGSATRNYSRTVSGEGFMVDTSVTIGYDTPWRQVEAMLIAAAGRTPGILTTPPPRVFQTALSDYYPEYCLVAQALPAGAYPRAEVVSRLHANIQDVFNEHGVQIMSPHYMSDPTNDKIVPREKWYTPPAREPEA